MHALNVVAMIIGLAIAGLGLTGVVAPSLLLDFGGSLLTDNGFYAVGAVRVVIGLLLFAAARHSRMPRTLRAIGIVVLIAGLATPLFGVERSAAVFHWFSGQGPAFVRVVAVIAMALGAFVVYASNPRRHAAAGH